MKKLTINPVYEWDKEDGLPINLSDPNIPDELRRKLYEIGSEMYGELEGGFEGIKILTSEEINKEYLRMRLKFDPIFRGATRAKKIFDFLMLEANDNLFINLERINDFLADKPINAYSLMKLIALCNKQDRKFKAQLAANVSHIETYELKKQAIDYWHENIDPKLSNDKAAELLSKVVPVSHRKLSQYVSEAKKQNRPPASKV